MVKNLPAVQETWIRSLGCEDPLEECMTTHSRILAWEIPWTEEPGRLQSTGSQSQTRPSHETQHRFVIAFLPRSKHLLISLLVKALV